MWKRPCVSFCIGPTSESVWLALTVPSPLNFITQGMVKINYSFCSKHSTASHGIYNGRLYEGGDYMAHWRLHGILGIGIYGRLYGAGDYMAYWHEVYAHNLNLMKLNDSKFMKFQTKNNCLQRYGFQKTQDHWREVIPLESQDGWQF